MRILKYFYRLGQNVTQKEAVHLYMKRAIRTAISVCLMVAANNLMIHAGNAWASPPATGGKQCNVTLDPQHNSRTISTEGEQEICWEGFAECYSYNALDGAFGLKYYFNKIINSEVLTYKPGQEGSSTLYDVNFDILNETATNIIHTINWQIKKKVSSSSEKFDFNRFYRLRGWTGPYCLSQEAFSKVYSFHNWATWYLEEKEAFKSRLKNAADKYRQASRRFDVSQGAELSEKARKATNDIDVIASKLTKQEENMDELLSDLNRSKIDHQSFTNAIARRQRSIEFQRGKEMDESMIEYMKRLKNEQDKFLGYAKSARLKIEKLLKEYRSLKTATNESRKTLQAKKKYLNELRQSYHKIPANAGSKEKQNMINAWSEYKKIIIKIQHEIRTHLPKTMSIQGVILKVKVTLVGEKQPLRITGTIASTDGGVLARATVSVEIDNKKYATPSDENGFFQIFIPKDIQVPSSLSVMASKEGFNTDSKSVKKEGFGKVDFELTKEQDSEKEKPVTEKTDAKPSSSKEENRSGDCSNISGKWKTNWGTLNLKAAKVTAGGYLGSYTTDSGRVFLRKKGNKLYGKWVEAYSERKCSREIDSSYYWGNVEVTLSEKNSKFHGEWSYCDSTEWYPDGGWTGSRDCSKNVYSSCAAHLAANPGASDGTYMIDPDGLTGALPQFPVYCDMTTDGGGWARVVNIKSGSTFHADNPSTVGDVSDITAAAKLSDKVINLLTTVGYWRYECGAKKRIFVKNDQNLWTSAKTNGHNWSIDNNKDLVFECPASRSGYGFSDYPACDEGHTDYAAKRGATEGTGCYVKGEGWGLNGFLWAK